MRRCLLVSCGLALLLVLPLSGKTETISLDEIHPGMKGEWHSVVSGTKIEKYPLEVLGVSDNFAGPKRSVIICQALDPENLLSGPVAGMSGSPVYIDGKLAGAYAYGFLWPKEQAIIGVTPIDQMIEVLDTYPMEHLNRIRPVPRGFKPVPLNQSSAGDPDPAKQNQASATDNSPVIPGNLSSVISAMEAVPTPLLAGGFSKQTLAAFSNEFAKLGLTPMQAPMGGKSSMENLPLEPGSAVAGVLMAGDFQMAATGTITYRDGDRLLAFGHPFFQMGPVEMPMAGADVITVVRSVSRSFKLSNPGKIIGTIYQDRLTGIAGKIGEIPKMAQFSVETLNEGVPVRTYNAEFFEHPNFSPLLAATSLMESLSQTMEVSEEQTIHLTGAIQAEGMDPITFKDTATGENGAFRVALGFYRSFSELLNNPYGIPKITSVTLHANIVKGIRAAGLKQVRIENTRFHSGGMMAVAITLERFLEAAVERRIEIPLPAGLAPGTELTVLVCDAAEADRIDGLNDQVPGSVADIAARWAKRRPTDSLYIKLLEDSSGLHVRGASLPSLPPSIRAQLTAPGTAHVTNSIEERTLWETRLPLGGEVFGHYRLGFSLE
ncbi:MAG: hypothetical protein SFY80_05895 [Verrucomicrobiota bacterium]|nr:hypothetical protein [Verrucomicrobiota bacterium]